MKAANRDIIIYIDRMLEDIAMIRKYVAAVSKRDFEEEPVKQDAVIRRIETLGEAVKRIPAEVRRDYPDIRWAEMAGMRDKLVHDYMGVDLDLVWAVTQSDLKPLEKCLRKIKKGLKCH
jgi:uncharacterized protein with HEPN domain